MKFQSLHVYYREHAKEFTGSVSVNGDTGEVKLQLTADEVAQVMTICADSLVRVSSEAAERMKVAILESVGAAQETTHDGD